MADSSTAGLLAIDVGNSRLKLAWYSPREWRCGQLPDTSRLNHSLPKHSSAPASQVLPAPVGRLDLEGGTEENPLNEELLIRWLKSFPLSSARCLIASVQQTKLQQLLPILTDGLFLNSPRVLRHDDLPITTRVDHPEQVGIDRLLNGVLANWLRKRERAAVIVSMGSAITVDRVAPDGVFEGGAILPGLSLSASALHSGTDRLPRIHSQSIPLQPPAIGKNTVEAIEGGLYWGALGAIGELLHQQAGEEASGCDIYITGGDALRIVDPLKKRHQSVCYHKQMVLDGIWLVAQEMP